MRSSLLILLLLLSACVPVPPREQNTTSASSAASMDGGNAAASSVASREQNRPQVSSASPVASSAAAVKPPAGQQATVYAALLEGAIGNGVPAILFFKANWCPKCRAHDEKLRVWYGTEEFPMSVYAVDYDNSLELKSRYGVVQQHTFVKIDGEGNLVDAVSFPTDEGLRDFLRS